MLKFKDGDGADCEVALDDDGAYVVLGLRHGKARFRQALSAADAGRLVRVVDASANWGRCCEGDLSVRAADVAGVIQLEWNDEGVRHVVELDRDTAVAFREALKGYCRLLMRTPCGGMT